MRASITSRKAPSESWVAPGEACKILGVHMATLRQWADSGRIRAFRTPGGHRRFQQGDIQALIQQSLSFGSAPEADWGQTALKRIRQRLGSPTLPPQPWRQSLKPHDLDRLRLFGRRLLALTSEYLSSKRHRSDLLKEAKLIGEEYGAEAARLHLPLHDVMAGFIFFQRSLWDMTKVSIRGSDGEKTWRRVSTLADEVLLATVGYYEQSMAQQTSLRQPAAFEEAP